MGIRKKEKYTDTFNMKFLVVVALLGVSHGAVVPAGSNPAIAAAIRQNLAQLDDGQATQLLTDSITKSILDGIQEANKAENPSDAIKATLDAALANPNLPRENAAAVQGIVDATLQIINSVVDTAQVAKSKKATSNTRLPGTDSYIQYGTPVVLSG